MSFSALYMHELHRKYYHGEFVNLESLHEESNRTDNDDNDESDNDNLQRSNLVVPVVNEILIKLFRFFFFLNCYFKAYLFLFLCSCNFFFCEE
jgi:hypothetical protein